MPYRVVNEGNQMVLYWAGWVIFLGAYVVLMVHVVMEEYSEQCRHLVERATTIVEPLLSRIEPKPASNVRTPPVEIRLLASPSPEPPNNEARYKFERTSDGRLVKVLDDEGEEMLSDSDRLPIRRVIERAE